MFATILNRKDDVPTSLDSLPWPDHAHVEVIAPHPDDFDAIAVTLQFFASRKYSIRLLVLSGGSKGVQDEFIGNADWERKAAVRQQEQLASTRLFGLADAQVQFLRMDEAEDGELSDSEANYARLSHQLFPQSKPSIWCLPYGDDSNSAHRRTYRMVKNLTHDCKYSTLALYNKDAKTRSFNPQVYTGFEQQTAKWKAQLLRCHQSQQSRNINTRGHGFDDRVLNFNQEIAQQLELRIPYAEVFQLELLHP